MGTRLCTECCSRCSVGRDNHTLAIHYCVGATGWADGARRRAHDARAQVNAAITTVQPVNISEAAVGGVQSNPPVVLPTFTNDNVNDLVAALAARSVDNGGLPINLPQSRRVHNVNLTR